jgi:PKD repeat protein
VTWTTAGNGNYNNTNLISPVYTPGSVDKTNGSVKLYVTTDDPDGVGQGCPPVTDSMTLTVNPLPAVNAGPNQTVCAGTPINLNGTYGGAASSVTWSTSSPGGSFSPGATSPLATYNPSPSDNLNGLPITLTLTTDDPAGPCPAQSSQLTLNISPRVLLNAGSDFAVCAGSPVNLSGTSTRGGVAYNSIMWSHNGGGSITTPGSLNTTYNPTAGELNGATITMTLTAADPDGAGPCTVETDQVDARINPIPVLFINGIADTVLCKSSNPDPYSPQKSASITLSAGSTNTFGTGSFSDLPGTNTGLSGTYFIPSAANLGRHTIRYSFTSNEGCSNYLDTIVYVHPAPAPSFTMSSLCQGDVITFTDQSSFTSTATPETIDQWTWRVEDSVYTVQNPNHTFRDYGFKNIQLTVKSGVGCYNTLNQNITIGPYPNANFRWSKVCSIDTVNFTDMSTIPAGSITNWRWDFGVTSATNDTAVIANPKFHFPAVGTYNTSLTVRSNLGCATTVLKPVYILATDTPTVQTPYAINFALSDEYWAADGVNSSWQWGTTAGKDSINNGSKSVWVTNTSGPYNVDEKSYLNSPCFNFRDLDRPMITLKIWSATQSQIAGAVLQASTNGGATWQVLGKIGDGQNWYDKSSIIGNPGSQPLNQYGWTGQYGGWRYAKLGLDALGSNPVGTDKPVRFRIAFGSSSDTLNLRDGFAIDSVWIGNKTKVVLLEHFTNYTSAQCATANTKVNDISNVRPNSVFQIHYHTSFPGPDPMNLRNTADPSARVLYYGVAQSPHTVLDGNHYSGSTYGPGPSGLDTTDVDARLLDDAKFNLKLTTTTNVANLVTASVKATANTGFSNDLILHTAVIERVVTDPAVAGGTSPQYEWVLKKMLPDASGVYISKTWNVGDSATTYQVWNYTTSDVYDPSQLGVVAFIQDLNTKEIYQAAYVLGTGSFGGVVSPIEDAAEDFNVFVYPNPSSEQAFVMFSRKSDKDYEWEVYDQLGKVIEKGKTRKGTEGFILNTNSYPAGIYMIRITGDDKSVLYKKLLVVH